MSQIQTNSKPFLKWAGGKTQMLSDIQKYIPPSYNNYIEPFIGAGAVFFHLAPKSAVISDMNEELIIAYKVLKDYPQELIEELRNHINDEQYFYHMRSLNPILLTYIQRASRLIYLNKTCFNGLYRVNKKGQFNTPFGKRNNPNICDEETLLRASEILKGKNIVNQDFQIVLQQYAQPYDLIFIDPPYEPVSEYADFKRYTKDFFSKEDQIRLKQEFDRLVNLGAFPILTNSDAPFILDLYRDYNIEIINTRRNISSNSKTRVGKDIIVTAR